MEGLLRNLSIVIILAPLLGCLLSGLLGKQIGRRGAHSVTIFLMLIAFSTTVYLAKLVLIDDLQFSGTIYTWGISGSFTFNIGFLIDRLTVVLMLLVTFVSTVVHIYSIGYMADDSGYQRFFSYVSMFTFAMLSLVMANNFLQLFFGWEGVGLVSYLLIGFWFKKESAAAGSLKAFLVNRAGDFGFLLGIAAILDYFGSLNYATVFAKASTLTTTTISIFPNTPWSIITVICILLFIGAMGKSAQVPLHVWLPESMEGPTPISALIHAATMVTAGVFMVARMSPLFELSLPALSLVLVIGATGALFLGILAFVEYDIKRVIAYSTMSQLGYMMAGDGASAFPAGIFHLLTHGCFKALLFLSAGSVIIAMHHEQDMRKMGNLKKYLPITYICFLIGALALSAIPPTAGFYSKDAIIEAVRLSATPGAEYAYICLLLGSFVTGYYIFRAFFMTFHTEERMDESVRSHLKEHWVMLIPMILLAIPAFCLGFVAVKPMLYEYPGVFGNSITILPKYNVLAQMAQEFTNAGAYALHALTTLPFWFAVSGIFIAWFNVVVMPKFPAMLRRRLPFLHYILIKQYGFDAFNDIVFTRGGRVLSKFFFYFADLKLIDDMIVNGSGRNVTRIARITRRLQSGYLYHYVFVMILGIIAFLLWMYFWR